MEMKKSRIAYLLLFFAAGTFIYFFNAVKSGDSLSFDHLIFSYLNGMSTESSYPFFQLFDRLGSSLGVGIVSLSAVAVLWIKSRNYSAMGMLVLAVALGNELNKWLKEAVGRPRPQLEQMAEVNSLSFPSGHAMIGMILYFFLAYLVIQGLNAKGIKSIAAIFAGLIIFMLGISRVIMQVHYPSDVAAGFAIGFIWVFIWIVLYETVKGKLDKRGGAKEKRLPS